MSEFDSIAQELLVQAEAEDKRQREQDKELLERVLEIYGQKYVAEKLRLLGQNEWSRERLNRRVNGKSAPTPLTSAEVTLLRKMLPSGAPSALRVPLYRSFCRYRRHP